MKRESRLKRIPSDIDANRGCEVKKLTSTATVSCINLIYQHWVGTESEDGTPEETRLSNIKPKNHKLDSMVAEVRCKNVM